MITRQEVFDKSLAHLRAQGCRAITEEEEGTVETCLYRGPNGTKCAIGALISDEKYHESLEGKRADEILVINAFNGNFEDGTFYVDLQVELHDKADYISKPYLPLLEIKAEAFAKDYKLEYK